MSKPVIVISGVNLVDMGPLSVFRDALESLSLFAGDRFRIIALVHQASLFSTPGVEYLEFPEVKAAWLNRLRFEYMDCLPLSRKLRPDFWLAMHDMTPRVECRLQAVYCHNPAPFRKPSFPELFRDPKLTAFSIFYRHLYGFFILRNRFIIVQQQWIRKWFRQNFPGVDVVVAHPALPADWRSEATQPPPDAAANYTFFYPAFPRLPKNFEVILQAVEALEARNVQGFEVALTLGPGINQYGDALYSRYRHLQRVRWLGLLSRAEVRNWYHRSQCLLFPSTLETWGLPLTEFKLTGKPILAAKLPYVVETIAPYTPVKLFPPADSATLASFMAATIDCKQPWDNLSAVPTEAPFAPDWASLWPILFADLPVAQLQLVESEQYVS